MNPTPTELHRKYRPTLFKNVAGNLAVKTTIQKKLEKGQFPGATLFIGPSGCAKTTLARICAKKLGCEDIDFTEINASSKNGVDDIRAIERTMSLAPIGKARVYILDEVHMLTTAAQNAALKMLEDVPPGCYFMLCTTDPQKIIPTVRSRLTEFKVTSLKESESVEFLEVICAKEKQTVAKDVLAAIHEAHEGAPRKMLVTLAGVFELSTDKERFDFIQNADAKKVAENICKLLMGKCQWSDITTAIKNAQEEPEGLRRMVLGYANAVLLNQKSRNPFTDRLILIIDCFSKNYFDTGKAGLTRSCYDVMFPPK